MKTRFISLAALLVLGQPALAQSAYDYYGGYGYNQGYYTPYSQPGYAYGYPSGYGNGYAAATPAYPSQAYAPIYGSQAPAYYPPAYPAVRPPPRKKYNAKGLNKMLRLNKEVLGEKGVAEDLWPGYGSIWDDVLPADGPWNRNWGHAPWNRDYSKTWGRDGGPDAWFDFDDPKEGAAIMWEDMINTPHGVGTQPGGWQAPSISVPNPIDVGDEFKNTARDMPDQIQNFSEGFTYGGRSWDGGRGNDDGGGITFNPNRNRR
jgi:hypothetical protein